LRRILPEHPRRQCGQETMPGAEPFDIIGISSVELLSNLIWLAVAASLWGLWLAAGRDSGKRLLLPRIGLQLVALGVLTTILLPAISITDDLQANHNPAEVERAAVGRNELQLTAVPPASVHPFALALLTFCFRPQRAQRVALLAWEENFPAQMHEPPRSLWSRPPPAL
jgi:hypothetical protein